MQENKPQVAVGRAQKSAQFSAARFVILCTLVIAGVGGLCAYSFYREEVLLFVKLQPWNRAAPERAVSGFLEAARKSDVAEATRCVDTSVFQPLKKGGKVIGYFIALGMSVTDYPFSELALEGDVRVRSVSFELKGDGVAEVKVSWKGGKEASYKLVKKEGMWKIIAISGGGGKPRAFGGGGSPPSFAAPPPS